MRWLRLALAGLLFTAVALTVIISAGFADPQPVGESSWTHPALSLEIEAEGEEVVWLRPAPAPPFSLRLTAVWQAGEPDSGAGLLLQPGAGPPLRIAVSPLGYATIQAGDAPPLLWQPWPHVRPGGQPNEIWLDVTETEWRVRLNRELLWRGQMPGAPIRLGVGGVTFGGTAVYAFEEITLFEVAD